MHIWTVLVHTIFCQKQDFKNIDKLFDDFKM